MVSEKIKNAIAITGVISYLTWIASDKHFQHQSDEIRHNVPGVQRVEKIPFELSTLVDELKERTRNKNYRIDDISEKYNALRTEYHALSSQPTIQAAREQIRANSSSPVLIFFFILGSTCLGYTMFNAMNRKKEIDPPRPAEATTASDADY